MLGVRYLKRVGPLSAVMTIGQVAWLLHHHWRGIQPQQRDRLRELVRESKGNPRRLSASERGELRRIVRGLNLSRVALDAVLLRRP